MKYQAKAHWCGPASIQNALALLSRRRVSQKKIAEMCGTTEDGTDEFGMMRGLRALGLHFEEHWSETVELSRVRQAEVAGTYLLCVDNWSHWVVVHVCGSLEYLLIDPERTDRNKAENGVHLLRWKQLQKRWECAFKSENREAGEPAYYALEVIG